MNINTIITNDNDIYVYFELIRQMQPSSILDIGMFLRRIGAVSRQAMSCEIPSSTYLEGIELPGAPSLPVYHKIYDKITAMAEYELSSGRIYDMAVLMYVNEWIKPEDRLRFWQSITTRARVIIADTTDADFINYVISNCRADAVNIENRQYAVIYGNIPQS